ncbi:Alpha/beta hydrolase fold-1 [Diaporthe sp. PMI_573]|nr:Alpha/beta hydrolase fold-1 [Diaporthaceae sp. PMI_573]
MTSSTTFVLVPGAWHPVSALDPVAKQLSAAGYTVRGVDLPSCGAEPPLDDFGPDVDKIRGVIAEEADRGQDVVLFMHSYGGVVGTESCRGLGKKEMEAAGKKGGLVRLIYCAAFLLGEGVSLYDQLGGKPLPWFIITDNETRLKADTPEEIFYNDLSAAEAKNSVDTLSHHSHKVLFSKLTYPAYKNIPTSYQFCKKDNAIPLFAQEKMVEDARALGVHVDTDTFDASHSPFLSMPDDVVAACKRAVGFNSS